MRRSVIEKNLMLAIYAVLSDHEERLRMYPEAEGQPHRLKVMEQARAALHEANRMEVANG